MHPSEELTGAACPNATDPSIPTRRAFHLTVIYGLWTLMAVLLGTPALIYLMLPPKLRKESDWIDAGDISNLPLQVPTEMIFHRIRTDGWKIVSERSTIWAVRFAERQVTAYGPQCTHLGCAYQWDLNRKEFLCPCHNSEFSLDGKVISGPAPRSLDRYDTKIENNHLLLGTLRESDGSNG
jgi:menaquinol-cytochrome c reductase iron-sulfur subunit